MLVPQTATTLIPGAIVYQYLVSHSYEEGDNFQLIIAKEIEFLHLSDLP